MPTTKAHFEAIGRVAYEWSRLELFAQTLIAGMAELPSDKALIVTNSGTIRSWMETIRRLAKHGEVPVDLYARCKKLTETIEIELYRDRNTVIHGIWDISWQEVFGDRVQPPPDLASKVTGLKKYGAMFAASELTAADVEAIADRIKQALQDLQWLTVALIDALRGKQQKTSLPANFPQIPQSSSQ